VVGVVAMAVVVMVKAAALVAVRADSQSTGGRP